MTESDELGAPSSRSGVLGEGLRVLGRGIAEQPRVFTVAVAGSALYGLMTVGASWVVGRVTDRVVVPALSSGEVESGALALAAVALVGVAVLKAAGIVARRLGAGVMQYRLQASYRRRVTRQYLRLPLSWHHRHPAGQLLSNANADVEATWFTVAPLPLAVGVLVMLVIAACAMLVTDVALALVGFAVFPAIFALNLVYQRRLSPLATRAQQLRAELSEVAHESFDGALVVKTLGREPEETRRFEVKAQELRDTLVAVGRVRGVFDPALEALPNLGVLAVLLVGSARLEGGSLEAGELVQVAYLFTLLAFPIRAIGWVLGEIPRSVVGWRRVRRVLDASGALPYGEVGLEGRGAGRLEVRDVAYAYPTATTDAPGVPSGTRAALRGVSFTVEPGRTVALVGATGSGKSTLANLLVRLVDPQRGGVTLDGVDLREMRPGVVTDHVAVVAQQAFLFDDTARGNVTLGRDVDDAAVWEALRLSAADGFVAALPDGLDTELGERGTTLSGGQRQRLALARALVRQPRLLVLDDATSSVDPSVEARILSGLRDARLPSTVVLVAYRNATIGLADEVVHLEHGRVAARGTHSELLGSSPGYRDLVTAYARAAEERAALAAADRGPAEDREPAEDRDEEVA